MSKNKYIYAAACKSQPVSNPSTELTKNMPETNRRGWVIQPTKKAPQKQSIKKANFLFFLSFVCFALLMISTSGWAELTGLTVDAGGDNSFRGGTDRLLIIFSVNDDVSDDGEPYVVDVGTVETQPNNQPNTFGVSLGIIDTGTVSANETVELFWDGTVNNRKLSDGNYMIRVRLGDSPAADDNAFIREVTLDSSAPRVSDVVANGDQNTDTPITDGGFIRG